MRLTTRNGMPSCFATASASVMSCSQGQWPMMFSSLIQFFMYTPDTSCPARTSTAAATLLSTPPDMAARIFIA